MSQAEPLPSRKPPQGVVATDASMRPYINVAVLPVHSGYGCLRTKGRDETPGSSLVRLDFGHGVRTAQSQCGIVLIRHLIHPLG